MRDVVILSSPDPDFLGPARQLVRGLRDRGRRVTLRQVGRGGRYTLLSDLLATGCHTCIYLGHGSAAGWSAWGCTGAGYLAALRWKQPIQLLINLTCEGDWARTLVQRGWVTQVIATPKRIPIPTLKQAVHTLSADLPDHRCWNDFQSYTH